jgi:hypothetical protein
MKTNVHNLTQRGEGLDSLAAKTGAFLLLLRVIPRAFSLNRARAFIFGGDIRQLGN